MKYFKVENKRLKITFDRLPGRYYGTGDTFAAMFLAWYTKLNKLKNSCEYSISAMLHILQRTLSNLIMFKLFFFGA